MSGEGRVIVPARRAPVQRGTPGATSFSQAGRGPPAPPGSATAPEIDSPGASVYYSSIHYLSFGGNRP
jgi:hypothetical protein